jgi:hypothetical protein
MGVPPPITRKRADLHQPSSHPSASQQPSLLVVLADRASSPNVGSKAEARLRDTRSESPAKCKEEGDDVSGHLLSWQSLMKAVNAFFTPLSQKKSSPNKMDWQVRHGTLIVGRYKSKEIQKPPKKIAAFDLVFSSNMTHVGWNSDSR